MWLVTTLLAAIGMTAVWFVAPKKYRLGSLSLMLWGASVMILVDHIMGYEGGQFFEYSTDGLVANGMVLGIVMLIPLFALWEMMVVVSNRKKLTHKR